MVVFGKQLKMSRTKQKKNFCKPLDKLQQPQQPQQEQQNDHRPSEDIQSDSSDSMPEIVK